MMTDWKISNYTDPLHINQTWVYYTNPNFPNIHMSRSVDNPNQDHMATNNRLYYYYGVTNTFNVFGIPLVVQTNLTDAWKDYFTV
ncbi:hypothetical protein [Jejuia spongiicola]|uniref:Uncharacterized protein n=1 Tax=Jejuia spongiicola TaxID=2942207 RepID=A0ABT0QAF3_9FLAO|nr:hypothetical protein [Jejuia spongiicola]MCL6293908.1 hypothetical protein [Jejuia spongiicola]